MLRKTQLLQEACCRSREFTSVVGGRLTNLVFMMYVSVRVSIKGVVVALELDGYARTKDNDQ